MTNDYGNLELHTVLLSAMKDIDRICHENGLRYYLHAGTLLGAMNHQGFIPWDDDVDIALMRSDYEKLITLIQAQFADRYYLQDYRTDNDYKNNRAVLRILGTRVCYYHEQKQQTRCEIGIDLVPLDCAPDNIFLRRIQKWVIWVLDAAVQIKQGDIIPRHPVMKGIGLLSRLHRRTLGAMIDRWAQLFNRHNTRQIGLLTYTGKNPYTGQHGYENDLMQKQWYDNPIYLPFEDTHFSTISEPEKDLVKRYGPHWAEPYPEEKRVTKHDVKSYEISQEVRERVGL